MSSKINVIFDEALVAFCGRVREKFAEGLSCYASNPSQFGFQVRLQSNIRDYIEGHQAEINLSWGGLKQRSPRAHPAFFAIFMCIISDLSVCESCDDALQQTDHDECTTIVSSIGEGGEEDSTCVCGHRCSVKNIYRITNKNTGLMVVVGQDCIKKYELVDPKVFAEAKREMRRFFRARKVWLEAERVWEAGRPERERVALIRANNLAACIIARDLQIKLNENREVMRKAFNALKKKCRDCEEPIRHLPWGPYCCKKPGCDCQFVKKHYCMCCGVKKYSKNAKR